MAHSYKGYRIVKTYEITSSQPSSKWSIDRSVDWRTADYVHGFRSLKDAKDYITEYYIPSKQLAKS